MKALPRVLDAVPNAVVVVVGGLYDDAFEKVASDLGVENAVLTTGPIPHSDVRHFLAAADVETHDLQGNGIGIATLEGMGAGVPIVTVNEHDTFPYAPLNDDQEAVFAEGSPESIAHNLTRLLSSEQLRTRVSEGGRRYVETHFSPQTIAARYTKLYTSLIDTSHRRNR
jgi:glycosyltransferase involved in cell wall biosynthesis